MSNPLSAYTDGIVQGKSASTPLELPELQALVGILTALPPAPLPAGNNLYQRVQSTLTAPSHSGTAELQANAVRVCLCLAMEPSNRESILAIVEAAQSHLDVALTASSSNAPSPLASDVLLLMTLCTGFELECRQALELFDQKVDTLLQVVSVSVATAAGAYPGVASPFKGSVQSQVVANLVSLLRELTSWKLYDHLAFQRYDDTEAAGGSSHTVTAQGPGNNVDMHRLASPFKGYVGNLCTQLAQTNVFSSLGTYFQSTLSRRPLSEQVDVVWEVVVLLENLLTFTNVFAVQLRKHLLASGVLSNFLGPFFTQLLVSLAAPAAEPQTGEKAVEWELQDAAATATLCARVLATMTFSVGGYQVYWRADRTLPVALHTASQTLLSVDATGQAPIQCLTGRERVELLCQLVRLVVNGHAEQAGTTVRDLWAKALTDERERSALAHQLSDPMRRRQPLDVRSPVYASLRDVFLVRGGSGMALGDEGDRGDSGYDTDDDRAPRGESRRQLRGRGRGRGHGRRHERGDGWGRGVARRSVRVRGKRGQSDRKRQRRRQRYAFLCSIRDRPADVTAAVEEQQLAQLSSDDDEEEEVVVAADAVTPSGPISGVDLSRWRKGPPPGGVPPRYVCALSNRLIMSEPALSPHGYVFDRDTICDYLTVYSLCPISGEPLYPKDLIVDTELSEQLARVRFNFINCL